MKPSPPLRFLLLVGGGWTCLRAAALSPIWPSAPPSVEVEAATPTYAAIPAAFDYHVTAEQESPALPPQPQRAAWQPALWSRAEPASRWHEWAQPKAPRRYSAVAPRRDPRPPEGLVWELGDPPTGLLFAAAPAAMSKSAPPASIAPPLLPQPAPPRAGRWSGSAWAFLRQGGVPQLASGGTLGGSQAGARLLYRLNGDPSRPLSLSARVYAPLESKGADAALGVEWQPVASLPVRLLAERRQSLSEGGRSAFSFLAHGGVYERRVAGPVLLDAYAQAGVVGLRSRDLFADGSAQLSVPLGWKGRLKAGAGIWGAAQPGVARIDAGPQLSARFPIGRAALRVSADWRYRLAGDADPSSGPALTLATEF